MHSTRRISIPFAAVLLALAVLWTACPPPPPPPPPGDTTEASGLVQTEEGLGDRLPDGGVGPLLRGANGNVLTPQTASWCMYTVTGPTGGAACFSGRAHICIMCPQKGCPQSLAGTYAPNMPQSGHPATLGCDMRFGGSPNAWSCAACDSTDDDSIGGLGKFGGYFRF